jgi:hypothetical protein
MRREFYEFIADRVGAARPTFDPSAARRHRGDRKVRNDKMIRDLGVRLLFPDSRAGLPASVA